MYKEVASQANTKQLRKAKLLESFRQQPTVTRNNGNRIMLTDLCPQEKAKIGDLVRTLQTRKAENMVLEDKIKQFERRQKKYNDKIEEMEKIIEEFKVKDLKFKQQLTLCKIKQQQRQRYIEHLLTEKQQQTKQTQKRKHGPCVDQFALTDPIITINQSVQASQKKKKCKEKQIQTQETFQFRNQARGYPHNSKSFEKIMRGRTQSQPNSIEKNLKKSKEIMKRSTVGKKSQIKIDDNEQEQEHYDGEDWEEQVNQSHSEKQDNEDDDFNELAKKWLQLKQKNMTKIKESYQKSKQRQNSSHSKGNRRQSRNTNRNIPRQFNERNIGAGQQQEEEHLQRMQNNQSFGPKRSNMKRSQSKSKGKQAQFDQDFDDIELNKILKSKNFSASRLLNKNTREISQQSEMQINRYGNRVDEKVNKNKTKGMQTFEIGQNTPNMKTSTISNSRSHHNIDFYETDLLDIVSSINRK